MMNKLRHDERGNVLVTAILLMSVMLSVGIAVASTVDTQTEQSRKERERESTFNLAEAALSAQTFILGRRGTGTAAESISQHRMLHGVEQQHLLPGQHQPDAELHG